MLASLFCSAILGLTRLSRPPAPPADMAPLTRPLGGSSPALLRPGPRNRYLSLSACRSSHRRSQDFSSGFTSSYDPNQEGRGPMFKNKANYGVPEFYPRDLKKRVDDFVVGQHRAKKTICSTIFNHYQAVKRREHHEISDRNYREKLQRQRAKEQSDEPGYDAIYQTYRHEFNDPQSTQSGRHGADNVLLENLFGADAAEGNMPEHVKIDKSNLLLLGPTGVGKTYILETLSKMLNVPFTISDCNSFTQAGYVGQDVETCIERLLIEANYDVDVTQRGIVVLDEFDKIARKDVANGRDVGGEGVQQALLKLVEGTKVTITIKDGKLTRATPPPTTTYTSAGTTTNPGQQSQPPHPPAGGRSEQFIIDTSNILFVFCGAFVGLDKIVMRRVSKPSLGFGAQLSPRYSLSGSQNVLPQKAYSHLPHQNTHEGMPSTFTPLDLTTPADLQTMGFIPELIGRLHNICALSPLSLDDLYRILTEPRNSLVAQYTALFETYPSKLFFTQKALYAIAERAAKSETGARGLKMEMERVLAEPIFDAPMPYVLITEACVRGDEKAAYWGKDGKFELERRMREEDGEKNGPEVAQVSSFEQFREAGESGA
ncbi:hypothetical protein jhhlp_001545 [Lomentospora prolificans]|uniref:AAA+ ATPase domain-containing protein n=1 Tax=Lomentospora prolificans TaxID=41688 RepID=A0A2N3NII4_9PEZI|nr:hypothetical protein jhhlp_001545 [Lomentospora prolificans]